MNHRHLGVFELWQCGVLLVFSFLALSCSKGNPIIKSLGLKSESVEVFQLQQSTEKLKVLPSGLVTFQISCSASMTSFQYSMVSSDGPWNQIDHLDCSTGKTTVSFVIDHALVQKVYFRTVGSWGTSRVKTVDVDYKMSVSLEGVLSSHSNSKVFSINVSGEDIAAYKYSFGLAGSLDCTVTALYSSEKNSKVPISASDVNYGQLADGNYKICIMGKTSLGVWGKPVIAEMREWAKDTIAQPAQILAFNEVEQPALLPSLILGNKPKPSFRFKVIGDEGAMVEVHRLTRLSLDPSDVQCDDKIASGSVTSQETTFSALGDLAENDNDLGVKVIDSLGNLSRCQPLFIYRLDSVAPAIASINATSTLGVDGSSVVYGPGQTVHLYVFLSEPVIWSSDKGNPSLTLKVDNGTRTATFVDYDNNTKRIHFSYTIVAGDDANAGISVQAPLIIPGTINIRDSFNNNLNSAFNTKLFSGIKVDTAGPTLLGVTFPNDGWYKLGSNFDITATFSEAVTVSGTPKLDLASCGDSACSSLDSNFPDPAFVEGSGTTQLKFRYTIAAGAIAKFGLKVNQMLLNGGSLKDISLNNAVISLTPIFKTTVQVDGNLPTVASLSINGGSSYSSSKTLTLALSGASDGTNESGLSKVVVSESGCNSGTLSLYDYNSSVTHTTLLNTSGSITLYVSVRDFAGNNSSCQSKSMTIDLDDPTIASFSLESGVDFTKNSTMTAVATMADVGSGLDAYLLEVGSCGANPLGTTWTTLSTGSISTTTTHSAGNGTKTSSLWVRDKSGRKKCLDDSVILDTLAPTLTSFATIPTDNSLVNGSTVSVTSWVMTDATTKYSYCWVELIDGAAVPTTCAGSWSPQVAKATAPLSYTLTTQGKRDLYLLFKDEAGNVGSVLRNIEFDSVAPTLTNLVLKSPTATKSNVQKPTFTVSGTFAINDVVSIYDGNGCTSAAKGSVTLSSSVSSIDITLSSNLSEGSHKFSVKSLDLAGNSNCVYYSTLNYEVDTAAPTITSVAISGAGVWTKFGETISSVVSLSELSKFDGVTSIKLPLLIGSSVLNSNCIVPTASVSTVNCSYTVGSGDIDSDGVTVGTGSLIITGTITDTAGNTLNGTLPNPVVTTVKVDGETPNISGVALNDGDTSTDLTSSPLLSWNAATDFGSGINKYTLEIRDPSNNLVSTSDYGAAQVIPFRVSGLSLTDNVSGTSSYQTYTTHLIVTDVAGNKSEVFGDGWKVVYFNFAPQSIAHTNSTEGFGKSVFVSEDGKRLVAGLPELRKVRIFEYNAGTESWVQKTEISDPGSEVKSRFGFSVVSKLIGGGEYLYAIGAPGDASTSVEGGVYVYKETAAGVIDTSTPAFTLGKTPGNALDDDNEFGYSLQIAGAFLVVGIPGADSSPKSNIGSVKVYPWNGSSFGSETEILTGTSNNDSLGKFIAGTTIGGDPVVYGNDGNKNVAYILFSMATSTWSVPVSTGVWNGSDWMTGLKAEGPFVTATEGTKIYYSNDRGLTYANLALNVVSLGLLVDRNGVSGANIGTYVVASTSLGVNVFKLVSGTLYFKQNLLVSWTQPGAITGAGHQIFVGDVGGGKIYPLR